jgi:hypothetical protein
MSNVDENLERSKQLLFLLRLVAMYFMKFRGLISGVISSFPVHTLKRISDTFSITTNRHMSILYDFWQTFL